MKSSGARRTIAIAGLGAAARTIHLPACAKLRDRLAVVAGCDPAPTGRFRFPVYPSLDRLLAETRPDIVAVTTPPATHFGLTRQALEAGCHVVCEKPFMTSLEEADRAIDLARAAGLRVVVNNQYRYMRIHREARRLIGGPRFGALRFLAAEQTLYHALDPGRGWRDEGGRHTCLEFGTHVLDLCRFFFGAEPVSIQARMLAPKVGGSGPDLLDLLRLEFPGDRVAQVTLNRMSHGPRQYLSMRLDGDAGCLETRIGGGFEVRAGIQGGSRRPFLGLDFAPGGRALLYQDQGRKVSRIATDPLDLFAEATHQLLADFLDALDRGETPASDAEDSRKTLALMLAAYRSHESGSTVRLT